MAGERILVIDDTPLNVELIVEMLEGEGYELRTVSRAADALAALETFLPHLILLDIQLPDMDGLDLTRRMKADPRTAHIPVIAITSHAMRGDDQRAYDAGCEQYLTKPVDTRKFPQIVRRYVAGSEDPEGASKR